MSEVSVGVRMPENWYTAAGINQMLPANTPKSGIVRMALAIFKGMPIEQARSLANPATGKGISGTSDKLADLSCKVPAELAEIPDGYATSYAIRIGVAMSMGYSRKDAETFAYMERGWPKGKPRKDGARNV